MGVIFWEEFLILWRFKLKLWRFQIKKFGALFGAFWHKKGRFLIQNYQTLWFCCQAAYIQKKILCENYSIISLFPNQSHKNRCILVLIYFLNFSILYSISVNHLKKKTKKEKKLLKFRQIEVLSHSISTPQPKTTTNERHTYTTFTKRCCLVKDYLLPLFLGDVRCQQVNRFYYQSVVKDFVVNTQDILKNKAVSKILIKFV